MPAPSPASDRHDANARIWVEFDDPDDARRRYRCDLTWLTSRWTCIYGRGCKSIFASVPDGGCCVLGAHFNGPEDLDRVAAVVAELDADTWQNHPGSTDVPAWTEPVEAGAQTLTKTKVVDGACIFQNRSDFATGAGCAMHHLAARDGRSHIDVLPEACWQLPMRRTHRLVEHPDGTSQVEVTITEYTRRDWGAGWRDLDWYCTDNPEAHVGTEPVVTANRDELVALMGASAYAELLRRAEAHLAAVRAVRAGDRTMLPLLVHPATLAAQPARAVPPSARAQAKARRPGKRR